MKKSERLVDSLFELLKEKVEIEMQIEALPRGYISVKQISGHTYNYRQWREGSKIVSEYVPDAYLNSVKRKISARKEHESHLRDVKKEIRSISNKILRAGLLSEEEIEALKGKAEEEIRG